MATVKEIIEALEKFDPEEEVLIWLPGTRIELGKTANKSGASNAVLIQGNVLPRSTLGR